MKLQVSVFRFQHFKKNQITKHKYQINHKTEIQNTKQLIFDLICNLVLVICYFRIIRDGRIHHD